MKNLIYFLDEIKNSHPNRVIFISIALILILGFALYSNSLNGKFIWDDNLLVRNNSYIKSCSHIPKIFTKDIGAGGGERSTFYRPLQILSYMLDYSLWKLDVRGYHFTNILLHILAGLVLFWLVNVLCNNRLLSLITTLLFIVHPIHTEAIAYISGRADPLALLFMLICFVFYIKSLNSKGWASYILMLLGYTLALLSRENSLILPGLLLLYHYAFKKKLKPKEFLSILLISSVYIALRLTALRHMLPDMPGHYTVLQRLPGFFVAITNYIRLLFVPFHLHMVYGYKQFSLTNPKAITGLIILLSLLIYALRVRNTNRLTFFCLFWFFLTLLPVSNLYPINAYMAEHWLYLPSIGFFLLLAKGISDIYRTKQLQILAIASTTALLVFYSYLTVRQNIYWREPLAFYERTLNYAPDSEWVYNRLGLAYFKINRKEKAIATLKRAIEINPDYAEAYNNIAYVYYFLNKEEEAIASLKKSIEIKPDFVVAYYNLGNVYYHTNRNEQAIALYNRAIEINPDYAPAYNSLGNVYNAINRIEQALASYMKAIEINPDYVGAYNNLANTYAIVNKKKEAIALYKKVIKINPGYASAYHNLGNTYRLMGRDKEAIRLFQKTIQISPNYALAYDNLAKIYFQKKQYKLAIEYCDRAAELGLRNPALLEDLKPYRNSDN